MPFFQTPLLRANLATTVALFCFCWGTWIQAETTTDQQFMLAREAFRIGNAPQLKALAPDLQKYPLSPYIQYWELRSRLEQASTPEILSFLQRYSETLVAEKLRADWLRLLAKKQQWAAFAGEYSKLTKPEEDLACLHWQQQWAIQENGIDERLAALWLNGKELAEPCETLLAQWLLALMKPKKALESVSNGSILVAAVSTNKQKKSKSVNKETHSTQPSSNQLALAKIVARFRLAAELGSPGLIKRLLAQHVLVDQTAKAPSKKRHSHDLLALWQTAHDKPLHFLTKLTSAQLDWAQPIQREIVLYALHRLARVDAATLTETWQGLRPHFPTLDQQYGNGWVATYLTRQQRPEALSYFANSSAQLNELQKESWARAALRACDWTQLLVAVSSMAETTVNLPVWQYWRGRALREQGEEPAAKAIFTNLLSDLGFYGLLAREELHVPLQLKEDSPKLNEELRQFIAADLGMERAVQFLKLGLRQEGLREWDWASRTYSDLQLLAAAELAAENQWFDLAINTANRTREHYDWSMRFLAPYRQEIHRLAEKSGLEEGLVLGLIRQESRFNPTVVSPSGAKGLMQIMPLTGKWIAKRLARPDFRIEHLHDVSVNLEFGVYYLKFWWERLANSATLTAAAYNAGPSRAQAWCAPKALPGEIYTETIPFTETRDYVKKVLANAVYYEYLLNQRQISLKNWLGIVPARS